MERVLLNGMHHTDQAGHRSGNRQGCLKGTRKGILLQLENWLTDEQEQRIFWLNGLAGTGKSTIAQTFAETSFADGKLGASFFCSRDFEDRSSLQTIFPTLAFQLAYRYMPFREELLRVLRADPGVGRETLCSQVERLIVGPLKTTHISTLIIIDALDECKDEEPASAILSILSRYINQIPHVRFFITGRPEPRIRSGFRLAALRPITEVLKLHDVERPLVDIDIKLFFRTRLTEIIKNRSHPDVTEDWPLPSDINILCEKAAGLFIYASTVVKFVASPYHRPPKRLALLVSLPQNTAREGESGIDSLYIEILRRAYRNAGSDNQEVSQNFRSVVGAVVLAFNPISMKSLSSLLHDFDTPSDISTVLNPLHSLLLVPEVIEDPVRIFHKSFPDFLMDPKRCQDTRFFVDPAIHHTEILLSCLKLMEQKLRRNICGLDEIPLDKVDDLSDCRKEHIGDALEYACQFWTKHLVKSPSSGSSAEEVQKEIKKFFTTHLLHWIEVLIVMKSLDSSVYSLNDIKQWYTLVGFRHFICSNTYSPLDQDGNVCQWADDSQRFILEHFDAIHNSPSQIYQSALPFSPPSSWLHKYYTAELLQVPKVVKGAKAEWGACSRTVSLDTYPLNLSYWNNIIAIGSLDGDIMTLDAITGSRMAVLSGHTDNVNCVTFSSDGRSLASGADDRTAKLWDMQTGGIVRTFPGHTGVVLSISISADSTRIVSGSGDKAVCLWDTQTGECICTIKQQDTVRHVSFSPIDPQHIISISGENVWKWDLNGQQILSIENGTHIAFSPDHTKFALCNGDVITVQDSNSRAIEIQFHITAGGAEYCCFSPDGRLIAAAAGNTAYVWDITSPNPHLVGTLVGHTAQIWSLVFSSPSSLISVSLDRSVKFWQIGALSTDSVVSNQEPTQVVSPRILSVGLQARTGIAISSDEEGVVKTWDISTGLCKASFQTPAGNNVWRDARVIDGWLVVVWYKDNQMHIWDTNKNDPLKIVVTLSSSLEGLRISGDGSKVFCLSGRSIWAWSIHTGKPMGGIKLDLEQKYYLDPLQMDSSKIWIRSEDFSIQGWDFGVLNSLPVPLFDGSMERPLLDFIGGTCWQTKDPSLIKNIVTGKEVFQLSGRYVGPVDIEWDGQYLVAGYESGEVLILDFCHLYPQ